MIHPHTELRFIDDEIGSGVFATQRIPKGTITWARDKFDQEFTPSSVDQLDPLHADLISKFAYRNGDGNFILCWDFGRYVNHSFHSNCFSTGYDFEIAIRDIETGEELTNDYGYLNVQEAFQARDEGASRKSVYPDDLLTYHQEWDAMIKPCLPLVLKVAQPLFALISSSDLLEIIEAIEGRREMRSILTHYANQSAIHSFQLEICHAQ